MPDAPEEARDAREGGPPRPEPGAAAPDACNDDDAAVTPAQSPMDSVQLEPIHKRPGPPGTPGAVGDGESDESLARRAQKGEQSAAWELMMRWANYFFKMVANAGIHSRDRADAIGDLTVHLLQKMSYYDGVRPIKPWLTTVAHNYLLNWSSQSRRRQVVHLSDPIAVTLPAPFGDSGDEFEDLMQQIHQRLLPADSQLFNDHFRHGMNYDELAQKYLVSVVAMRSRVHRLRQQLHRVFPDLEQELRDIVEGRS
jgi:RNA polymerase sigma factor (sigma-70 family)